MFKKQRSQKPLRIPFYTTVGLENYERKKFTLIENSELINNILMKPVRYPRYSKVDRKKQF